MTSVSFVNFPQFEIGSNHLEVFLEIDTLEKYMKSMKSTYERVHFLVYLYVQNLQLNRKGILSRILSRMFLKLYKASHYTSF